MELVSETSPDTPIKDQVRGVSQGQGCFCLGSTWGLLPRLLSEAPSLTGGTIIDSKGTCGLAQGQAQHWESFFEAGEFPGN